MQSTSTTADKAAASGQAPTEERKGAEYSHSASMAKPDATGGMNAGDLAKIRKEYGDLSLDETMIPEDGSPLTLFREWLNTACELRMIEPNACALATVNAEGRPSNRFVLLKDFDERGFVWFTNYESRKGNDISANPYAAMTFWWGPLEKSVRVEGRVEKVAEQESDEYFQKRPRGAELGAWASDQSRPIADQTALKTKYTECEQKFEGQEQIDRPAFWGGYRLVPDRVEFWKGRRSRLHDRIEFKRQEDGAWATQRLQP